VIGYSQCAHGIDMRLGMDQQYRAVAGGHWPLVVDPVLRAPATIRSCSIRIDRGSHLGDYMYRELRYRSRTANADPVEAERLLGLAEQAIEQRWNTYEEMASGPETFTPTRGTLMGCQPAIWASHCATPWWRRHPLSQTVDGVRRLPTRASVQWCSIRCSKSNCAAKRSRTHVWRGRCRGLRRSLTYFPATGQDQATLYLSLLERAAGAVSVPVIGSLNGSTPGNWAHYARSVQDCGAAAIESNIYYLPGDPHIRGRDVEQRHRHLARVKDAVTVPVAVKLSPVLQRDRRDGDAWMAMRTGLFCSIDSCSPTSTPRPSPWCARCRCPLRRRFGCRLWIALLRGRVGASLAPLRRRAPLS
jgi:hypothetical protein